MWGCTLSVIRNAAPLQSKLTAPLVGGTSDRQQQCANTPPQPALEPAAIAVPARHWIQRGACRSPSCSPLVRDNIGRKSASTSRNLQETRCRGGCTRGTGFGMNLAWQHPDEGPSEGNAEPVVLHRQGAKQESVVGDGLVVAGMQLAPCTDSQPRRSYILVGAATERSIRQLPRYERRQL